MSTSAVNSRDDRWNYIDENNPKASLALLRDIIRDFEQRLSDLDVNGAGLVIPTGHVTESMLAADSVSAAKIQADAVGTSEIAPAAVTETEIATSVAGSGLTGGGGSAFAVNVDNSTLEVAADAVKVKADGITKLELAGGFLKATVIAGGAAGDHTVTGIASGDELVLVARLSREAVAADIDLSSITGEFTISATNTINNASGTDTTGDALLVMYLDLT